MTTKERSWIATAAVAAVCFTSTTPAQSKEAGWKPLFNGTNLDGFYIFLGKGPKNADPNHYVQIEGGVLHMYRGKPDGSAQLFGYLSTESEFENYHLRFEYQWGTNRFGSRATAKRDAGVIYHMFGNDTVWPNGVECQVQEGDVGDIFTVNTRVATTVDSATTNVTTFTMTNAAGIISTNSRIAPTYLDAGRGGVLFQQGVANSIRRVMRGQMQEHDGWNTVEVVVRGDEATHIVNGRTNNFTGKMERFAGGKWQPLTKGKIIFQLEGAEVFYRNLELKDLPR